MIVEIAPFVSAKKIAVPITAFIKNHLVKVFMMDSALPTRNYTFFNLNLHFITHYLS